MGTPALWLRVLLDQEASEALVVSVAGIRASTVAVVVVASVAVSEAAEVASEEAATSDPAGVTAMATARPVTLLGALAALTVAMVIALIAAAVLLTLVAADGTSQTGMAAVTAAVMAAVVADMVEEIVGGRPAATWSPSAIEAPETVGIATARTETAETVAGIAIVAIDVIGTTTDLATMIVASVGMRVVATKTLVSCDAIKMALQVLRPGEPFGSAGDLRTISSLVP